MKRVVTISASYGAGGSVIGPALAKTLDMPFLDRALPAREVSGHGTADSGPSEEAVAEERTPSLIQRIVATFARLPDAFGTGGPTPPEGSEPLEDLRQETETRVRAFVEEHGSGVVLGWGATVLLPEAFHVRLHGPAERRVERAMEIQHLDRDEAKRRQQDTDRVRSQYLRRLYGRDWNDVDLFHLVLDTTSLPPDDAVRVVAEAARAFWAETAGPRAGGDPQP